jgi:hypothetical protein
MNESIICKVHDIINYHVPQLSRLPRDHKFLLGDRIYSAWLDVLALLVEAYYKKDKLQLLRGANIKLEIIRHLVRIEMDMKFIDAGKYKYINTQINELGCMLGGG